MALPEGDIITLDNVASRITPWRPDLESQLFALIDMGSNGIRFAVSDLSAPRTRLLKCIYRERAGISLFDALSTSPAGGPFQFPPDVVAQVSRTLARFRSICDDFGVPLPNVSVFATEAMRKAENAVDLLQAIRASSGLRVQVLAPEVEALFGAMGARSAFGHVEGLFLDLGGGSVQMSYMNSSEGDYEMLAAKTGKSLPFGAAKLMQALGGNEVVGATALQDLQAGMLEVFEALQRRFPALEESQHGEQAKGVDLYLCGGGFRGYGSILMHNDPIKPYPIPSVGAYTVPGQVFSQTQKLRRYNDEYDGKIFGMSKRRRQQFPAAATVVEALLGAVPRIRTVTFCSGGNREGALLLKLPPKVREAAPLPLLHQQGSGLDADVTASVLCLLLSALPSDANLSKVPTVLSLGLDSLFISKIWSRAGERNDANASFELHQAITRDPGAPGLTHLARAILGLTLYSRWGAHLGHIDELLYTNLRKLAAEADPDANFWAEYIGAVSSLISKICPVAPTTRQKLESAIRLSAKIINGKKKLKVQLTIGLSPDAREAVDLEDLAGLFSKVGNLRDGAANTPAKVEVQFSER